MHCSDNETILDFTDARTVSHWKAIDDRIMGGCSLSRPEYVAQVGLRFAGTLSVENSGGFASIRSAQGHYDLSGCKGISLRLRGDGQSYKLSLRTDHFYDGVSYQTRFTTRKGQWQEISFPFYEFVPTHHGTRLSTVAPIDPGQITSFGLFIAERQEGPFQLEVQWIKGWQETNERE